MAQGGGNLTPNMFLHQSSADTTDLANGGLGFPNDQLQQQMLAQI